MVTAGKSATATAVAAIAVACRMRFIADALMKGNSISDFIVKG